MTNGSSTTIPSATLTSHLQSVIPADGSRTELVGSVLPAVVDAIAEIAGALRAAHRVALAGTANTFGDDQLNVDVIAENILRRTLAARCPSVVTASSEEDPVEKAVHTTTTTTTTTTSRGSTETYTVAFDPLDGSSIIAPNWTVGTILGIWDGPTAIGQPSEKQVVSILGVLGPRTTAIIAIRIPGSPSTCFEIAIGGEGEESSQNDYEILRTTVRLSDPPFKTRYFAPANLRSAAQEPNYMALITRYIQEGYTLRYAGGLVPDIVHALVKGHGIYVSPIFSPSQAKLRRLYELFPVALIIECAGGMAVDPADGKRILDAVLESTDERAGLVCGTVEEVELVKDILIR